MKALKSKVIIVLVCVCWLSLVLGFVTACTRRTNNENNSSSVSQSQSSISNLSNTSSSLSTGSISNTSSSLSTGSSSNTSSSSSTSVNPGQASLQLVFCVDLISQSSVNGISVSLSIGGTIQDLTSYNQAVAKGSSFFVQSVNITDTDRYEFVEYKINDTVYSAQQVGQDNAITLNENTVITFTINTKEFWQEGISNYNNLVYLENGSATVSSQPTSYISTADIALSSQYMYVADSTRNNVYKLSLDGGNLINTYNAGKKVNCVVYFNNCLYVGVGGLDGDIIKLDENFNVVSTAFAGHTPSDIIVHNDKVYVANTYSDTVGVYSTNLVLEKTIKVAREPLELTVANNKIYVACHLANDVATADIVSADLSIIDTKTNTLVKNLPLLNGTSVVKGIATSTNGKYVYLTAQLGRYFYPATQVQYGWENTNAMVIVDTETDKVYSTVMLDQETWGAPNPWGIRVDNNKIYVTLSGINDLMVIDESNMLLKLANYTEEQRLDSVAGDFSILSRKRVSLNGIGCRKIEILNGKAYICQYFSGTVEVVDIFNLSLSTKLVRLGTQPEFDNVRKGEIMWNDASLCYQEWRSCASCHPDGRNDGLNWDELNDGIGNPKQTKSLIYSYRTPPCDATGIRATCEEQVRASFKNAMKNDYIQSGITEEEFCAMDEYLKSLVPVQSPYLNRDGSMSDSAIRGLSLFNSIGCASCHNGANYSDLNLYYTKVSGDLDDTWEDRKMITPTLVETWRSAPYTYIGGLNTMEETVAYYAEGLNLSEQKIKDIANYILSLGAGTEYFGVEQVRFVQSSTDNAFINIIQPNRTLDYITIVQQREYSQSIYIRIAMVDENGNQVGDGSKVKLVANGNLGTVYKIDTNFTLPQTINVGAYYVITIVDENGNYLATPFVRKFIG